jgi:hypothetical protein
MHLRHLSAFLGLRFCCGSPTTIPPSNPMNAPPLSSRSPIIPFARMASLAEALLAAPSLHAQLYWDNNGSTAGFGTAGGTCAAPTTNDATQGWSTSATGVNALSGTTTNTTSGALNFGTAAN